MALFILPYLCYLAWRHPIWPLDSRETFKVVLSQNFSPSQLHPMNDRLWGLNEAAGLTGHLLFPNDELFQRDSAHSNPTGWAQKSLIKSNSWFPGDRSLLHIRICMHSPPLDKDSSSERCSYIRRRRGRSDEDEEFKRWKPNKQDNRFKYWSLGVNTTFLVVLLNYIILYFYY